MPAKQSEKTIFQNSHFVILSKQNLVCYHVNSADSMGKYYFPMISQFYNSSHMVLFLRW